MQKVDNQNFICQNCQQEVEALTNGSFRNHCPFCLYSLHVDIIPGDRSSNCLGLMKPVSYRMHPKKGYQIKHQCQKCDSLQWNKVAENTIQNDDLTVMMSLPFE